MKHLGLTCRSSYFSLAFNTKLIADERWLHLVTSKQLPYTLSYLSYLVLFGSLWD